MRTGVTAVLPRGGQPDTTRCSPAWFALNGNGEMTGTTWVEESGQLEGPVLITNTHSVGVVRDAAIAWRIQRGGPDATGYYWSLPVVAETWDGHLNDINGFHVKPKPTFRRRLDGAGRARRRRQRRRRHRHGLLRASRAASAPRRGCSSADPGGYTVGVLVQANYGMRDDLRIAGVPVGPRAPRAPGLRRPTRTHGGVHHHRRRHRRAAAAATS